MKKILLLSIIVAFVISTGCRKESPCPQEMNLGFISLEDSTRDLFYDLSDTLVFKNTATDEEMRFFAGVNNNFQNNFQNRLTHPCLQTNFNIIVSYTPERMSQQFVSEDGEITLQFNVDMQTAINYDKLLGSPFQDIQFYELFSTYIWFQNINGVYSSFVASDKGVDLSSYPYINNVEGQNIAINGVIEKNVYYGSSGNIESYFSKEKRLIGYKDNNLAVWLFDRIE